jgi:hypothetical protein
MPIQKMKEARNAQAIYGLTGKRAEVLLQICNSGKQITFQTAFSSLLHFVNYPFTNIPKSSNRIL